MSQEPADPRVVSNPPGLPQISGRVDDFTGFRRALLRPLPGEQAIGPWRPAPGDLGLQVLEWWAYLGDVLTFYNERIANESYLRTATQPGSVANLVALLGYQPAPGLAATGHLAAIRAAAHPAEPLVIPAGLPVSSAASAGVPSQTFEVGVAASLAGPSSLPVTLAPGPALTVGADGGARSALLAGPVSGVGAGDKLLLADGGYTGRDGNWALNWALVTVGRVTPAPDSAAGLANTLLEFSASTRGPAPVPPLPAEATYRLLRPSSAVPLWNRGAPVGGGHVVAQAGAGLAVHLYAAVRGISPGDTVLFDCGPGIPSALARVTGTAEVLWAVRYPAAPGTSAPSPPDVVVPHTVLTVATADATALVQADPATVTLRHGFSDVGALTGVPAASLASLPVTAAVPAAPPLGSIAILADATGTGLLVTVAGTGPGQVTLAGAGTPPSAITAPLIVPLRLLTHLVPVSRGTTVTGEVLGSGNAALASQSFTLASAPLTYLAGSGGPVSTLAVYVDGVRWQEVASFYTQASDARVFTVSRSPDQAVTTVIFGDGINGARLTSGTGNVTATYRYGSGAASPPAGRLTTILAPQPNLASVQNPVAVSGGADPQTPADVRANAPASVLTFGRAVSAADYETIAAQAPGVSRVAAAWTLTGQRAAATVYVDGGQAAAVAANAALAAAGGPSLPLLVLAATPIELRLSCTLVIAADRQVAAMTAAAAAAVADPVTGLFSPAQMGIGQRLYRSAIDAALMVPGVVAVHGLTVSWPGRVLGEFAEPGEGSFFDLPAANVTIGGQAPVADVDDGFDSYYAERLWQLLPAVYRTADTDGTAGPLRELLNRIGAQVAVVRRSIDHLWADQSVETCADWVIPYLGDLLGTSLIANLDARAQRLDVAKTIHYRRRKGTVALAEELALDVTGWTAHAVEGFRRLGRTRHGLDPAVGPAAYPQASAADVGRLLRIEGLAGLLTSGLPGGFADLRAAHGAALAGSPFGESFHTADMRAGRGAAGHFGLAKLLVFVWRLISFPVTSGTPVAVAGCPGQFVFDPTGRQIPLFLPPAPARDDYGASWTPAREWQVPGPLTSSLEAAIGGRGPAGTDGRASPADVPLRYSLSAGWQLASVWPETGRFAAAAEDLPPVPLTVSYQYGFPSLIGAGPYHRDLLDDRPAVVAPDTAVSGGTALPALPAAGTVTIGDSLTYQTLADAGSATDPIVSLVVRAGPGARPVLRPPPGAAGPGQWIFTGGAGARLVLDGLTVSGCDIVLRGAFDTVRLTACTVDPGTALPDTRPPDNGPAGSSPLVTAADGVPLAPCRIFIEADPAAPASSQIGQLLVDHCVIGPVRTRSGGSVGTLTITDSVVQGLRATSGTAFTEADVFDPDLLARGLAAGQGSHADPASSALLAAMPPDEAAAVLAYAGGSPPDQQRAAFPLGGLNALVSGPSLYRAAEFAAASLSAGVLALAAQAQAGLIEPARLPALNRALMEECFPVAIGVASIAVADATVQLTRVTVLGRIAAHRLSASDSILACFAVVDDVQDGCVRFSAYVGGSAIPRQYASAVIAPGAPIFTSESYGQPGYAQLTEAADAAVTGGAAAASIVSGAESGSEMGAFCADLNPVRERGLLAKYAEYMPLGLEPVIVHVT